MNDQVKQFVSQYQPHADAAGAKLGIDPKILLGQWGLETGWGKSVIPGTNNLGNIKGPGVAAKDNMLGTTDTYRKYATPEAFAEDYAKLIGKKRYSGAVGAGSDVVRFAQAMKAGGYAEDPDYAAKLVSVFEQVGGAAGPAKAPASPPTGLVSSLDEFVQVIHASKLGAKAPLGQPHADPLAGFSRVGDVGWGAPGLAQKSLQAEDAQLAADAAAQTAQVAKEQAITQWDRAKSIWANDSIPSDIRKARERKDHVGTVGFDPRKANPAAYAGQDSDAFEDFDNAVNEQDLAERVEQRRVLKEHQRLVYGQGFWTGMGAEMLAAAPIDGAVGAAFSGGLWLAGRGAYKAAKAGMKMQALATVYAENAATNVAITATRDLLGTQQPMSQYALDLGTALLGPAIQARSINRVADAAVFERTSQRIMADKVADLEQLQTRARATLPDSATPEEVEVAMARIKVEDLAAQVKPQGARKILAEVEETEGGAHVPATREVPVPDTSNITMRAEAASRAPEVDMEQVFPLESIRTAKAGVTISPTASPLAHQLGGIVADLAHLLPKGLRIGVGSIPTEAAQAGVRGIEQSGKGWARIGFSDIGNAAARGPETAYHEVTHAVTKHYFPNARPEVIKGVMEDYGKFVQAALDRKEEAVLMRWADKGSAPLGIKQVDVTDPYQMSLDEYLAEQGVRWFRDDAAGANTAKQGAGIVETMKEWGRKILQMFFKGKAAEHIPATKSFSEFMQDVVAGRIEPVARPSTLDGKFSPSMSLSPDLTPSGLSTATKYGLDLMPVNTPLERAKQKQMVALYEQADAWAVANPMDAEWEKRVATLNSNRLFNVASTSANMLMSRNPVVRMVAAELLESPSGAAGRRPTAALRKHLAEGRLMGNTINDFQATFNQWRREEGVGIWASTMEPQAWYNFNRSVSLEIEGRAAGAAPSSSAAIRTAADVMEAAYERARVMQTEARTTGWASLPTTSVGYMPHRMSPTAIRNLSNEQARTLHGVLSEQFQSIEGWDVDFSNRLADKYLDRVQKRALGDYDAAVGVHQTGAMDAVEEALQDMGMTDVEVRAMMTRYMNNAAGHTKRRIKLDLTREYGQGAGAFRLADVFETDHIKLLRSQAHRVSGEVALADNGIMGLGGLKIIRQAMQYGETGAKAEASAVEAFDQVSAEFMGQPFGNHLGKWGERAMIANSLARLNGMGFTQLAETVNGVTSVGFLRTLASMGSMRRLNQEINALARGEVVDNPILGSVESWGREFGTDNYKLVFPFDNPEHAYNSVGMVDPSTTDRLLRMASHAQGKITLFRAIHGVQQRGMAEQIIRKASDYLRTGSNDAALRDMGFDDGMMTALRADLPNIARYDGDKLVEFNINNATNREAAEAFVHAVHRGAAQIIQGAFIGETGAWAHSGWLKILTQFRTFSILAVEKQWGRNRNNLGIAKAGGILLGSMIMVAPIVMARAYATSVGRPDQEEDLAKKINFLAVSRASLNMVANAGYLPDFLDAMSAVTGMGEMTGGRAGTDSQFVGNLIAPSAGLLDQGWAGIQNTRDGTDPTKLLKTLPFGNHPLLTPFINSMAN